MYVVWYKPAIWVTCSNKLEVLGKRFPTQSSVTHDLLDQSYGLCGVGLIKENNSVKILCTILFSIILCLGHEGYDLIL